MAERAARTCDDLATKAIRASPPLEVVHLPLLDLALTGEYDEERRALLVGEADVVARSEEYVPPRSCQLQVLILAQRTEILAGESLSQFDEFIEQRLVALGSRHLEQRELFGRQRIQDEISRQPTGK